MLTIELDILKRNWPTQISGLISLWNWSQMQLESEPFKPSCVNGMQGRKATGVNLLETKMLNMQIEICDTFMSWQQLKEGKQLILKLKVGSRIITQPRGIEKEIINFYKKLYWQPPMPKIFIKDDLLPRHSKEEVMMLGNMPSLEEIKEAVWCCESSKSLGYDGFNFNFIKQIWDTIEDEFSTFILNFLNVMMPWNYQNLDQYQ